MSKPKDDSATTADAPTAAENAQVEEASRTEEPGPSVEELELDEAIKTADREDIRTITGEQNVLSPQETSISDPADSFPANAKPSPHSRQHSLSLQSKLRSTSFRRTSTAGPVSPSAGKSPQLADFPEGDSMPEIYRKQATKIAELENENKRLEKMCTDGESRWRRSEEELEDLRESKGETATLRQKAKEAEESSAEIQRLRSEIASLQRQSQSTRSSHSHSISKVTPPPTADTDLTLLRSEIESKTSTITDMELEISNLRTQLSTQTSSCTTHGSQITALQAALSTAESKSTSLLTELNDAKKQLSRASEKAVQVGVERTSTDTRIKTLERDLESANASLQAVTSKSSTLEQKLETLTKLHREAEARHTAKLSQAEAEARESSRLRAKLASVENENLRLREERDHRKKTDAVDGEGDLDELEDEERRKLKRRIRELESETFELRRGIWRDRRKELQGEGEMGGEAAAKREGGNDDAVNGEAYDEFDEVDLSGPYGPSSARRKSLATSQSQKHSSFTTVLSSGLAAFRGESSTPVAGASRGRGMSHTSSLLDDDDDGTGTGGFDEEAFRQAQREEEAKKMIEKVREVKRGLSQWKGWRLDLVDGRGGVGGGGDGVGEVFEV